MGDWPTPRLGERELLVDGTSNRMENPLGSE